MFHTDLYIRSMLVNYSVPLDFSTFSLCSCVEFNNSVTQNITDTKGFGGKKIRLWPFPGLLLTLQHKHIQIGLFYHQWRIQDFPEGGGREPSRGGVNTPNFPENCMKSKEFGRPGGACVPHAPPRSANDHITFCCEIAFRVSAIPLQQAKYLR